MAFRLIPLAFSVECNLIDIMAFVSGKPRSSKSLPPGGKGEWPFERGFKSKREKENHYWEEPDVFETDGISLRESGEREGCTQLRK